MDLVARKIAGATGNDSVRSGKGARYGLFIKGSQTRIGVFYAERSWGGYSVWHFVPAADRYWSELTKGPTMYKTKKELIAALARRVAKNLYK